MFGFFKTKPVRDDFYQQHQLPAEWEPYLNIGALLIEGNLRRDSLTLRSRLTPKQITPLLQRAWNIHNGADTKVLVEDLMTLPVMQQQAFITSEQLMDYALYQRIKDNCEKNFSQHNLYFSKAYFDGVKNLAAWDIERAGLVVRYAFNAGWLTQEEALQYLQGLHKLAKQHYTNWLDYYLGYLKGRIIIFDNSTDDALDYIFALSSFYKEEFFVVAHPL
ncbi:DUF1266 domain-containing protein [Chitinophaga rhizophila]|uniref:DUF1266 domain-containing protein n=1 Tax=Chitinophaga rhizophila TaxID=2866212 RepID=A0ABS7GHG0_9BACT|nr:DUF1266 domain-containing protein [Chitinophaga rhizophila]MBW8687132.1 DUF1266 domain-containing protein [Chitinophaga rhizophila]